MILCSGCFDGLHAGHVAYFEAAAKISPWFKVVCAVAPDGYIVATKGRAPYWPQQDRAIAVQALRFVDGAIFQEQDSVADVIRAIRPRYFVKGADWRDRLPADVLAACQETQTEIVYVDTPGRHVSEARP